MASGRIQATQIAVMRALLEHESVDAIARAVATELAAGLGWDAGAFWEDDGRPRAAWGSLPDVDDGEAEAAARVHRALALAEPSRVHRGSCGAGRGLWAAVVPRTGRHPIAVVELRAGPGAEPPQIAGLDEALLGLLALVGSRVETIRASARSDRELGVSPMKLDALAATELIGFALTTTGGRIVQANDAYLTMVQGARDQLDAGELRWDRLTPHEWAAADQRAVEQVHATGYATPYAKEYLRPDGTRVPVLLGAASTTFADRTQTVIFALETAGHRAATGAATRERMHEVAVAGEGPPPRHTILSEREMQVLRMLAVGKSVKQIGVELSLSEKTVSTYRSRLLAKLELSSNAEAMRYALRARLVDL